MMPNLENLLRGLGYFVCSVPSYGQEWLHYIHEGDSRFCDIHTFYSVCDIYSPEMGYRRFNNEEEAMSYLRL